MGIKSVLSLAIVVTMFSSVVQADILQSEDFESATLGNGLGLEGWTSTLGFEDPNLWVIVTPGGMGNATSRAARVGGGSAQVHKSFADPNTGITDTDDVFYRTYLEVGGLFTAIRLGARSSVSGLIGPKVGFIAGAGGLQHLHIREASGNATVIQSATIVAEFDWYELVLRITQAGNMADSTGTLFVRNLSKFEPTLTQVADLTDINLGLSDFNKPALWDQWYMDASFSVSADQLAIGTGVLPSPADIGDFNSDGKVDGTDFLIWQRGLGTTHNAAHLTIWEANYPSPIVASSSAGLATVPEPSSLLLVALGLLCRVGRQRTCLGVAIRG